MRVKLWIRIDAAVRSDPNVAELANRLKISIPEAVGHCVLVWCAIAEHRPDGILTGISISALEEWGGYRKRKGKPLGAFGKVFTELFLSDDTIRGWRDRQGALIDRTEKETARKFRNRHADIVRTSAVTERNGTEQTTKATTSPAVAGAPKESRIDLLPKADCDALFEKWSKEIGAIPYPRFRKALLVVRSSEAGRTFAIGELLNAIEAYGEWFAEQPDREQGFTSLEKTFVGKVGEWVRLGKMPIASGGELTERGKIIGTKQLRRGAA